MGRKMTKGKQQVLFNYLPGQTFDFEKVATIARVSKIKGIARADLKCGEIRYASDNMPRMPQRVPSPVQVRSDSQVWRS